MRLVAPLELLRVQFGVQHGRFPGLGVIVAEVGDVREVWIGDEVPAALVAELGDPSTAIDAARRSLGELSIHDGPSYVLPEELTVTCDAPIVCSAPVDAPNPGNWLPVEWDELLAGRLGPWSMVVADGCVRSICHTPKPLDDRSAECGVWTDPAWRGRGYATATAAAWLPLVRAPDRHLFYCTNRDNLASQRVAARLGGSPIGWTWRARRPEPNIHPLCSLATSDPTTRV